MIVWKDHSKVAPDGSHAFLSPSNYHWINYDDEKLIQSYKNWKAAQRGTILHKYAEDSITLGQRLPRSNITLNAYVNDAIGFRMRPEQRLYFSSKCFGTADAIAFRRDKLRIHDLKTGITPASLHQLEIYNALFCLDYGIKPGDIETELRIYQNNDILIGNPTPEIILPIMDKIVRFSNIIEEIDEKEGD